MQWPGQPVQNGAQAQAWPGQPVTAPAAAPARQPAPPRQTRTPAPISISPALNDLGITDAQERDALIAQGYTPQEADAFVAEPEFDPGMYAAQPAEPFSQADGAAALAADQLSGVVSRDLNILRVRREPWLRNTPRYVEGGGVEDGEISRAGVIQLGDGTYEIFDRATNAYYPANADQFEAYMGLQRQGQKERLARVNREADPSYQAEYAAAQEGTENVPKWLANLTHGDSMGGLTYVIGASNFLDPMTEGIDRNLAAQAGRDAWRDRIDALIAEDPVGSIGMQLAGGLLTPGLKQTGDFIGGASGAERLRRAGAVGAGYGAVSGGLNATGNIEGRFDDVAAGALTGAGAGVIGQGTVDRLARGARAARAPSNVRALSRAGVNVMPAQMMSGIPVLGRAARVLEQGAASIPFVGAVPAAAERESVRSFNRAAINRVLGITDDALPAGVSGREAIRAGDDAISARYRAALDPVVIQPDAQINSRIMAALNPRNLSRNTRNTLQDTAADIVERLRGPVTGQEWKQIDSELSGLINATANGDAASRPLSRALRDVRSVVGDALEQAAPGTLARVRQADDAFGNFALIRKAASNPTTGRNDGLFTPANLNSVLARSEGRAYGRGEARLQDLVDPAMEVMAGTLPNSGSAERLATIGLATGAAGTGAVVNPAVAIPVVAGVSAIYSQPVQRLINFIYRLTDSREAGDALQLLARAAQRDPALLPYYEAASQHVLSLGQNQAQANPPAPQSAPLPMSAR